MNIQNKFDLYIENKLSDSEKDEFERDLLEQPELAQSYRAYFQINHIMENELYSPVMNYENDPILKDLSLSQRLSIEEEFLRFNSLGSDSPDENLIPEDAEKRPDQNHLRHNASNNLKSDTEPDEESFLKILQMASEKKSPGRLKKYMPYIGIAAAVIFFFFAGKIIFELNLTGLKKISPQLAYKTFYRPGSDNELKSLNFYDSRLKNAFLDFKRSGLNTSAIFSNQMKVSDVDYELSLLFLGLINLERKEFPEARKCFNRILSMEHPLKGNSADFYLSLAYLAEGYMAEAEPFLIKLSETKNPYRKRARVILRSLKRP